MYKITKREKLVYLALFSVIISIILLSVITDVYARYSSTLNGSGSIELAKWEFKVNSEKEGESYTIIIKSDSGDEKITPNSTGYFKILLENNSNVPAESTISFKETFLNTDIETDTLKIYLDDSYSDSKLLDIKNKNLSLKLDGETNKEITLFWKWVETSKDELIAENYDGFKISSTVVGEQTQISDDEDINVKIVDK